jgi:predicted Fe-Mo cluster-binding NifX family protein
MLLAVPEFRGRVSPAFDFCHKVTLWRLDDHGVRMVGQRRCKNLVPHERPRALQALGVQVLLCGAIGRELELDILSLGIEVHSGLAGEVAEVVEAYGCQALDQPRFRLVGTGPAPKPCRPEPSPVYQSDKRTRRRRHD